MISSAKGACPLTLGASIKYNYNHWGDLETVTDPEDNTTTFEYDEQGRVISVTDHESTTRYQRDLQGQIIAVIDPEGGQKEKGTATL